MSRDILLINIYGWMGWMEYVFYAVNVNRNRFIFFRAARKF